MQLSLKIKKILFATFLLFIGFSVSLSAQIQEETPEQNVHNIKGRLIPFSFFNSFGLGYEYRFSERYSTQVLLNYNSFIDWNRLNIIPEVRYHFKEEWTDAFFISSFIELGRGNETTVVIDNRQKNTSQRYGMGLAIGRNIKIGDRRHIDLYFGRQATYSKKDIIDIINNEEVASQEIDWLINIRIGINLNFTF